MTTTTTQSRSGAAAPERSVPAGLALDRPARPRRLPWALLGLLIVTGSALAFALWATALGDRVQVLVADVELSAGEVLERDDLRTVELAGAEGSATVSADEAASLVGLTVVGPVPAGTLVAPEMFSTEDPLAANEAIVGAVLAPGQFPGSAIRPGDTTVLVRPEATDVGGPTIPGRPLGVATIWSVEPIAQGDSLLVGFRVTSAEAIEVADAAAAGVLRMITVSPAEAGALVAELQAARTDAAVNTAGPNNVAGGEAPLTEDAAAAEAGE